MARKRPAYAVEAWFTGEKSAGPQCSAAGEYCFFCASHDSGTDCDPVADLKAVVQKMAGQRKELSTIVNTIHAIYNEHIRPEVVGVGPTGTTMQAPLWSKKSISTHLIYSTEFPSLFKCVVTQIHQSIIMQLNNEVIVNNAVMPAACEELRRMVASLKKWENT